jgi:hypothetical protein
LEQNAFDLLLLFGGFVAVMGLPVFLGIVAVLREKED